LKLRRREFLKVSVLSSTASSARRRRVLHFKVTCHPTAAWVVQQLREAFPETGPYRYAIFDHASRRIAATGAGLGDERAQRITNEETEDWCTWRSAPRRARQ